MMFIYLEQIQTKTLGEHQEVFENTMIGFMKNTDVPEYNKNIINFFNLNLKLNLDVYFFRVKEDVYINKIDRL